MSSGELIFRAICSVLAITTVLGNSLVILVTRKSRSMKTPINYLLLNLAAADLMVGVFVIPRFILDGTFTHPRGISGDVLCKLISTGNLAWVSSYSSVFSLVFIAFERYYAIMKPLSIRHRMTTRKLKIFIPICWALAVILVAPYFHFKYFDEKQQICRDAAWPTWFRKLYYFLNFFLVGILPTSIMAVLYSRVIHRLWFKTNSENTAMFQAVRRSRKKVTKTMLTLSAIYVLCWFPDSVMHFFVDFLLSHVSYSAQLHNAFLFLIVLNSTVNPIVYAFQFEEFRKELKNSFCCEERHTRIHATQHNSEQNNTAESRRVDLEMKAWQADRSRAMHTLDNEESDKIVN